LILLTSPEYLEQEKAEQMLAAIHDTFAQQLPGSKEVPLIGSSVSASFTTGRFTRCALLICLASGLIELASAVGENARQPRKAP